MVSEPASLLAVMAHPDDPELWAGGTVALHARDAPVTLAVTEHEAARMAEAAAGAAILGAALAVLPVSVSAAAVAELITEVRPDVLITHLLTDVHPGHRETAEAVLAALPQVVIATGRPLRVYAADTYNSLKLLCFAPDASSDSDRRRSDRYTYGLPQSHRYPHFFSRRPRYVDCWRCRTGYL